MIDENQEFLPITEARLQSNCYLWFWNNYPMYRGLLFHVPNGGSRNAIEAGKLKAMGVTPGIPDMIFLHKAKAYFFEFKEPGGKGRVSPSQKKIHEILGLHLFEVWLIESEAAFKDVIHDILGRGEGYEVERLIDKAEFFYRHNVAAYLYSLDPCRAEAIERVCEEENVPKFVQAIEDFIEAGYG